MPHICIVVARFYESLGDELLLGATAYLDAQGASYDVLNVPGAFEIPAAIAMAVASGYFQGYVALGCVIRGETSHYDYVCAESARGLGILALQHHAPIGNGILTVENEEQAWERAGLAKGNKGASAAQACLTLCTIKQSLMPA